jgi:hypothetical protein
MSMSTLCFVVKSAVELVGFLLPVMLYAFVCSKRMWVLWTLYTLYWLMHVIHVNRLWGGMWGVLCRERHSRKQRQDYDGKTAPGIKIG